MFDEWYVTVLHTCKLLHDGSGLADKLGDGDVFVVEAVVRLRFLASLAHEDAAVWAHAGVRHADVGRDAADLLHSRFVDEDGGKLFLSGEDDPVGGFDTKGSRARVDGIQCVFYLHQLAAWAECGERERVLWDEALMRTDAQIDNQPASPPSLIWPVRQYANT